MVEYQSKFSTMDVLAPISMKNAARMRYAMWIAEPWIIGYSNATGTGLNQYTCFSVRNQFNKQDVREDLLWNKCSM